MNGSKSEAKREKNTMKIALLQIAAQDTLDSILDKGILFCRKAKEMGADLALFQKCSATDITFMAVRYLTGSERQFRQIMDLFRRLRRSQRN